MNTSDRIMKKQLSELTGENNSCFIVAELSANHNQRLEVALESVRGAKRAGADAIKLQTYTPDTLTIDCDNEYFRHLLDGTIWEGRKLYDLYRQAHTPWEWHEELFRTAKEVGISCFSSPFDKTAVDFLATFDPPAYKIASFEIQDIPLIEYVASKGKPILISTGIASLEDIELAVETCRKMGNNNIIVLKCTSSYPAPMEESNLLTIPDLKKRFGVEAGLSDHTPGIIAPVVAVALGARVIEKHFILDRSIGGPDASFSLEEQEFKSMVDAIRMAELSMGKVNYDLTESASRNRRFGRSLFVVKDLREGEIITGEHIRSIRPGFGMHPKYLEEIIGTHAHKGYQRGEPFLSE